MQVFNANFELLSSFVYGGIVYRVRYIKVECTSSSHNPKIRSNVILQYALPSAKWLFSQQLCQHIVYCLALFVGFRPLHPPQYNG
jgi:hypothetical protein